MPEQSINKISQIFFLIRTICRIPRAAGFFKDFEGYVKTINRKDCERVYRQENRFLYKGKSFRYRDESDGKILLIDNSKNNGFELRLDYDEYGKWVNISDGEKIIWTEEF